LLVMLGTAMGFAPWAILNECLYGMALGPTQSQLGASNWGWSANSVFSVLASPSCGLFVYQPWLLVGPLSGFWFMGLLARRASEGWRRPSKDLVPTRSLATKRLPEAWGWCCAVLIVLQVLLVANWKCWWGGDCWGSRLLADVIPFCGLLCLRPTNCLMQRRWGIGALIVLGLISIYIHSCVFHSQSIFPNRVRFPTDWSKAPFIPDNLRIQ
jgi:hypothetical protein